MTISELIAALKKMKDEHGDLVVGVSVAHDNVMDMYSAESVEYAESSTVFYTDRDSKPLPPGRPKLAVIMTEF